MFWKFQTVPQGYSLELSCYTLEIKKAFLMHTHRGPSHPLEVSSFGFGLSTVKRMESFSQRHRAPGNGRCCWRPKERCAFLRGWEPMLQHSRLLGKQVSGLEKRHSGLECWLLSQRTWDTAAHNHLLTTVLRDSHTLFCPLWTVRHAYICNTQTWACKPSYI